MSVDSASPEAVEVRTSDEEIDGGIISENEG